MTTGPSQSISRETAFRLGDPAYAETAVLDDLRRSDFARLDRGGHVYLDYTGGGLYAQSQLREHMRLLDSHVLRQPALDQPQLGRDHRPGRARPSVCAGVLQRLAR
jgi:molybdenum cofactor sulfurtransferase